MIGLAAFLGVFAVTFGARIPCKRASNIEEYIVGGTATNITEIPYQASLHVGFRFYCGASIISPTHLVTAAHCVSGSAQRTGLQIKAGTSYESHGGVFIPVKNYYYHPKFTFKTVDYDVAVLELETPLKFGPTIQPIKLAEKVPADGEIVKVSGWGCIKENGPLPESLQSVEVPIVNRNTCEKNYEKYMKISPRMICAGVEGKDSCQGDSGGPLAYKNTLAGIVSTGEGCARKGFPGIYTNVANPEVRKFIKEHSNV